VSRTILQLTSRQKIDPTGVAVIIAQTADVTAARSQMLLLRLLLYLLLYRAPYPAPAPVPVLYRPRFIPFTSSSSSLISTAAAAGDFPFGIITRPIPKSTITPPSNATSDATLAGTLPLIKVDVAVKVRGTGFIQILLPLLVLLVVLRRSLFEPQQSNRACIVSICPVNSEYKQTYECMDVQTDACSIKGRTNKPDGQLFEMDGHED
jgi:hypothetical protein